MNNIKEIIQKHIDLTNKYDRQQIGDNEYIEFPYYNAKMCLLREIMNEVDDMEKDNCPTIDTLHNAIFSEVIEYDNELKCQLVFDEMYYVKGDIAIEMLIDYFNTNIMDVQIVLAILNILCKFDHTYEISKQHFNEIKKLVMYKLSSDNLEIVELSLLFFEIYGNINDVESLEMCNIGVDWLDDYRRTIIGYIIN